MALENSRSRKDASANDADTAPLAFFTSNLPVSNRRRQRDCIRAENPRLAGRRSAKI